MTVSEKLRSLAGESLAGRGISAIEMVSFDRGTVLMLAEIAEAAEAAVKIDATSSYSSIYSAPTEMAGPLRVALNRLEARSRW